MKCIICGVDLNSANLCDNLHIFYDLVGSIIFDHDTKYPTQFIIINDEISAYFNEILLFTLNYQNFHFTDYFGYSIKPYTMTAIVRDIKEITMKNNTILEGLVKHGIFYYLKI